MYGDYELKRLVEAYENVQARTALGESKLSPSKVEVVRFEPKKPTKAAYGEMGGNPPAFKPAPRSAKALVQKRAVHEALQALRTGLVETGNTKFLNKIKKNVELSSQGLSRPAGERDSESDQAFAASQRRRQQKYSRAFRRKRMAIAQGAFAPAGDARSAKNARDVSRNQDSEMGGPARLVARLRTAKAAGQAFKKYPSPLMP